MSGDGAVAPLIECGGARVETACTDVRSKHGQNVRSHSLLGNLANLLQVVCEGLPSLRLGESPWPRASAPSWPARPWRPACRQGRRAVCSSPRFGRRTTSRNTAPGSARSGAVATLSHASAARTPPRWRNCLLTPPFTATPSLRRRICTGASEAFTRAKTAISLGSAPRQEAHARDGRPGRLGRRHL